jgi:hypothetical protein
VVTGSKLNSHNLKNVTHETSRYLRDKKVNIGRLKLKVSKQMVQTGILEACIKVNLRIVRSQELTYLRMRRVT